MKLINLVIVYGTFLQIINKATACAHSVNRWCQQMHLVPEQSPTPNNYTMRSFILLVVFLAAKDSSVYSMSAETAIISISWSVCRNCIMEWCNEKPECPLCRTPITHSSLVCLYHSDFQLVITSTAEVNTQEERIYSKQPTYHPILHSIFNIPPVRASYRSLWLLDLL